MNQRRLADDAKMIPPKDKPVTNDSMALAEDVIFDKAEQAEQVETEKQLLLDSIEQHKSALKAAATAEEKQQIEDLIKQTREQLKSFEKPEIETTSDEPVTTK
jgi:molecular chaperone DnaK (HSP70)